MYWRYLCSLFVVMLLVGIGSTSLQAASNFADPAFQTQWQQGEAVTPNFWGSLDLAKSGQQEPYQEAQGGQRLVQYFDKARMELTNGKRTNGLLTVELITGQMQKGDATFEQRAPARINIAGDPGTNGLAYADLASVVGKRCIDPCIFAFQNGKVESLQPNTTLPVPRADSVRQFTGSGAFDDPANRYHEFVPIAFAEFVKSLSLPITETTGYAITPLVLAQVQIGGKPTWVLVQAFERRVLTYTEGNPDPYKVEFGNIGQHYYQWRYGMGGSNVTATAATPKQSTQPDFSAFAKRWGHHGYQLVVDMNGSAHEDQRTYNDCSSSNKATDVPCEDPYTSYAAHTAMQFTSTSNGIAKGKILTSNYPREEAVGDAVTLTLKPYDMAEVKVGSHEPITLCGPDYSKLAPPDIQKQGLCGA